MLPKSKRISRKEFPFILQNGARFNSPHLLLYIAKKENLPSRFSFSVSKKILKKAVDRNTYRRRGYSVISKNISSIKDGFYLFFTFKKGVYPLVFKDLEKEVVYLLTQSSVLL